MKYTATALDESEVMKRFIVAILKRAVRDNAVEFISSEYCELMCGVIGKENSMLLRVAERKR